MTQNDLYEIDKEVYKNIECIKREQAEFIKGVELGMELMFKAVRDRLCKEEERSKR